MVGAAMPEAAIDEHSDAGRAEGKISAAAHSGERKVDPISQTLSMQQPPDGHLRFGISPSLADHTQKCFPA